MLPHCQELSPIHPEKESRREGLGQEPRHEQTTDTQTDSGGHYSVPNLLPGDYELSVSAEGYSTNTVKVTILPGASKVADVTLGGVLSLGDLGFTPTQTQGSAQD